MKILLNMLILLGTIGYVFADSTLPKNASQIAVSTHNAAAVSGATIIVKIAECTADSACATVRDTSTQVMQVINETSGLNASSDKVTKIVVPKFDFRLMTKLALGSNWKLANKKQQDQLTELFQQLLVYTYSSAVSKFKNAKITLVSESIRSTDNADAKVASVVSQVLLTNNNPNAQPVKVEYDLVKRRNGSSWKAYDIKIEDASLVTTYRNQFNDIISTSKIDGLIAQLKTKIATLAKGS